MLGDMTIRRMDSVLIVVDDLEASTVFFTELSGPDGIIIGLAEQLG